MNPPHALTLELVEEVLRRVFATGWRIRGQSPLILGQDLDPEPDFAIIAGTARGSSGHPTTAELVIAVADSSLTFDPNQKRLLYARAAIREYWVVDINGRRLLVYRDPRAGDYAAQLLDHARCRGGGAAGGQEIVNDQDAFAFRDGVEMNLKRIRTIFEVVRDASDFAR